MFPSSFSTPCILSHLDLALMKKKTENSVAGFLPKSVENAYICFQQHGAAGKICLESIKCVRSRVQVPQGVLGHAVLQASRNM